MTQVVGTGVVGGVVMAKSVGHFTTGSATATLLGAVVGVTAVVGVLVVGTVVIGRVGG
jgi:hypothetical protein